MASDLDARVRRQEREDRDQWIQERKALHKENKHLRHEVKRLQKRLKLMETTLVTQQQVLDRYQQELIAHDRRQVRRVDENDVPDNKRATCDDADEGVDKHGGKRAKRQLGKERRSLPLADCHPNDEAKASPNRRQSLPEPTRPSTVRDGLGSVGTVWTSRKLETEGRHPPVINATEMLRPRLPVPQPSFPRPPVPTPGRRRNTLHDDHKREDAIDSDDEFLNDRDANESDEKDGVKTEPKDDRARYQGRKVPFKGDRASVPKPHPRTLERPETKSTFAYVEVVRNREERAALPGHDCIECRKYYEALDGLVSEEEMKAKCSRHRARHQPYQTPDDFWRLSFPDSHSEDMLSP